MENQNIKRRSTFAVLFYINRTKVRKDGMCQLLCKVSIDAEWAQIGTKVSVNPSIWNPDKGRADGRSENAVTVNRAIDDLTDEITGHYDRIKNSLGFITAELVKNAVKGIGQKPLTLLALFREHNEEFKKRIGIDRIQETYDSYKRSYKHLSAFVQEKKGVEDVTLRSLDRAFYDDFELFLRTNRNQKPKTVHEHLYRLKKLTMRAVSQGTLRRDPYCRLHPELPKRKSRHMKLEDLKTLMTTPVEKPQLQFVRDMFIFSTFTGLAYADLKKLSVNDVTQAEDGSPLDIPLMQFRWDKQAGMPVYVGEKPRAEKEKRKEKELAEMAREAFARQEKYGYIELCELIQEMLEVKERTAKGYIRYMREKEIIEKEGDCYVHGQGRV